ncbi:hypothetical protein EDC18_102410 [Natranaerovirga pectinivora]|uniref:Uncharacterized protein n=1 Tax=Natranaerovirga pectinivora TaxID=682400 RepID=A0A4R3MQ24_9FIRM|nr:hypothetical protein [Natranaerovirga pectinivora]TCT16391.1 hypothetical protein EDC18_102410 [Natranaerovirga pectinivora]
MELMIFREDKNGKLDRVNTDSGIIPIGRDEKVLFLGGARVLIVPREVYEKIRNIRKEVR